MSDLGYVYVLANSSMPDVVKVGKTNRSTAERSQELSNATGLPTAFIVVYEQLFVDCTVAENFVHTMLEQKGFRVADNREFFSAPVNEIVRTILLAPGAIITGMPPTPDIVEADIFRGDQPVSYPWFSLYIDACRHLYGDEYTVRDSSEAIRLFKKAARLGSLDAYERLGWIHEVILEKKEKALEYFHAGARSGNAYCYWKMFYLLTEFGRVSDAEQSLSLFLKNRTNIPADEQSPFIVHYYEIERNCVECLLQKYTWNRPLSEHLNQVIIERKDGILREARERTPPKIVHDTIWKFQPQNSGESLVHNLVFAHIEGIPSANWEKFDEKITFRVPVIEDDDGNPRSGFIIVGKNSNEFRDACNSIHIANIQLALQRRRQVDNSTDKGTGATPLSITKNECASVIALAVVKDWFGWNNGGKPMDFDKAFVEKMFDKYPQWQVKINNALSTYSTMNQRQPMANKKPSNEN